MFIYRSSVILFSIRLAAVDYKPKMCYTNDTLRVWVCVCVFYVLYIYMCVKEFILISRCRSLKLTLALITAKYLSLHSQ